MRILHTSDWHLGRLFHEVRLVEEQAYVLEQVICCARERSADVVVVAGDIYDRAVPPAEAVSLLDQVLTRLLLEVGTKVILIAGNHDSPERLAFGATIMEQGGIHIAAEPVAITPPVVVEDRYGPVYFYPLPYAEPATVRALPGFDAVDDHNSATCALVERIRREHPAGRRSVLIAHAFLSGGTASESERPLSVGGAGTVDAACMAGFDYVALGHLHRPQGAGSDTVQYSGSILKYSFSEAGQEKSLKMIEMDAKGKCSVETVPLMPRHDVRSVSGRLEDIIASPPTGPGGEDFLSVTLLDEGAVYDPMGKLRRVYPHVLEILRPAVAPPGEGGRLRADHRKISETDLFSSFYREVVGETLQPEQLRVFQNVLERMKRQDREADR